VIDVGAVREELSLQLGEDLPERSRALGHRLVEEPGELPRLDAREHGSVLDVGEEVGQEIDDPVSPAPEFLDPGVLVSRARHGSSMDGTLARNHGLGSTTRADSAIRLQFALSSFTPATGWSRKP